MVDPILASIPPKQFLGVECGGTRSTAILTTQDDKCLARKQFGPANLRLLTDAQIERHLNTIAKSFPAPDAVGVAMAGARTASDHDRLGSIVHRVWPKLKAWVGNDLACALAAEGPTDRGVEARILILSGTGSCCYGESARGKSAKSGGWGHLLGDWGSGYDVASHALRLLIRSYDHGDHWGKLGRRALAALHLNHVEELIDWMHGANKEEVAALAPEVFAAAEEGDPTAQTVINRASESLVEDALACAGKLTQKGRVVEFVLSGSVLLNQASFAARIGRQLLAAWPYARIRPIQRDSVWGAAEMAKRRLCGMPRRREHEPNIIHLHQTDAASRPEAELLPQPTRLSPTESRNPRSLRLDKLSLRQAVELMLREEPRVVKGLRRQKARIEAGLRVIVKALRAGGALYYVGAGTSGRLGVLDASECPPTFRTDPLLVQGIMAGGDQAITRSLEGAEDDFQAGAQAVSFRGVGRKDVVVGVAASGRTPFIWGALHAARKVGAATILLCFNPHLKMPRGAKPDVVIAADVGPELLTGSTRLKAGTATKLVLNMFTTLAMVQLGKVRENLMIDLNPSNTKLRGRAVSIVQELTQCTEPAARSALEESGWVVKKAVAALSSGRSRSRA